MKSKHTIIVRTFAVALATLSFSFASAQMSIIQSGSAELSKDAKKGRFAGTYVKPDGSAEMFFLTPEGPYGYKFSPDGKFAGESKDMQVVEDLTTMQNAEAQDKDLENMPVFKGDILVGSSTWTGNLTVKTGTLYLDETDGFNNGPDFKEKQTIKPKLDDSWMSKLIGYRAYAPNKHVILKGNKHISAFTFAETGRAVFTPVVGGSIQAAGIVVEKVSIKKPSLNLQNTIAVFSLSGSNLENMTSNVIVTPYSQMAIGTGGTTSGNMAVMVMPANAPSTYKPHKRLRAPEDKRLNLYVYRVNNKNEVVDSVNFASTSSAVTFQYLTDIDNKSDIIFGFGNDKSNNWRSPFIDTEVNVMQFVKLDKNGQLEFHKTYTEDEITSKLIVPGAKKNSYKLRFYNSPVWFWLKQLDNGNYFFLGGVDGRSLAMLTDSQGNLIHFYVIIPQDLEKNNPLGSDFVIRGNNIYLAIWDQPKELSNDVKSKTEEVGNWVVSSKSQLLEIYHITQLLKFEGNSGDVQQMWLGDEGKKYYTMYNKPVIFAKDAMFVPGIPKGPKGKEIYLEKISY